MSDEELERRYRRLLTVYPWEHRRAYEEEMLAVLLADARPGQRRPRVADTANLIGAGLRARLRVSARGFTEPAWADAAAVTGLLVVLALFALAAKPLVDQLVPDPSLPTPLRSTGPDLVDWARVAGWAGVAVAALVGLRRAAAGLAWAAVAAWAVLVGPQTAANPGYVVDTLPRSPSPLWRPPPSPFRRRGVGRWRCWGCAGWWQSCWRRWRWSRSWRPPGWPRRRSRNTAPVTATPFTSCTTWRPAASC
ncbi:hypothetical protein [Micromonospora coerulea]|uniref:hypothetical protein n=1 Tax=Micromonospora coerulea TaxID=47856 RepID=UPI001905C8D8|nr:hypothetical protein [Micromonospora veneta]